VRLESKTENRHMWTVASSTAVISTALTDTGTLVAAVIASVVAAVIALAGLGFAVRHILKKITGKKF